MWNTAAADCSVGREEGVGYLGSVPLWRNGQRWRGSCERHLEQLNDLGDGFGGAVRFCFSAHRLKRCVVDDEDEGGSDALGSLVSPLFIEVWLRSGRPRAALP